MFVQRRYEAIPCVYKGTMRPYQVEEYTKNNLSTLDREIDKRQAFYINKNPTNQQNLKWT